MKQGGFTLLEVMVALVILVLAMMSLSQTLGVATGSYARLDDKMQAYQLASDKLVELQVYQKWPSTGTQDDRQDRFGRTWKIRTKISTGPYPDTRRVDIDVGPVPKTGQDWSIYYSLASLIGKPGSGS